MNKTAKWHARPLYAGMALALVAGLSLVPVMVPVAGPIVEAAVSNITVWVGDPTPSGTSNYTINFTTTVKLTTAVGDTIIVDFPTGTTDNTTISNITAATTWVNGVVASSVTIGGRRVSVTPGADVDAGNVTIAFGNSTAPIDNPAPQGNYTLTVYTTQEATAVNSSNYMIDTVVTDCSVHRENTTVNTSTDYNITFTPTTAMVQGDTITITFPATTTVPTSITGVSNVTINDTNLDSTSDYSVSGQTLTLTVPDNVDKDEATAVNITNVTGFKNPTTINSSWMVIIHTSKDRGLTTSAAYSTTAGNQSVITQINWSSYDAYVPNNTISDAFKIQTLDEYGNNATVDGDTSFILGADYGTFYDSTEGDSPITTINIEEGNSSSVDFYYKCTSPGTHYATAYSGSHPNWTKANQTVIVNPMVQLWGGGVIVGNYTTIAAAEAAALPYDTIKVLPSTYGFSSTLTIDVDRLTLESTGGAAQTIINGSYNPIKIHNAENVTVDGFTIENPEACGIWCYEADNATIKNNIVRNTTTAVTGIDVSWVATGVTVSDNQLQTNASIIVHGSNCIVMNNSVCRPLFVWPQDGQTLSNVNITNNTICDNWSDGGMMIMATGDSSAVADSVIERNTISNRSSYGGIYFYSTSSGYLTVANLTISNNTITDNTEGIVIPANPTWCTNSTAKNNNIYNNTHNGINSTNNATLTATLNYWGNASGPGGVGPGTGDNVTAYVTYSPWLNEPYPGGNTTAFSNIILQKNWNFISVPRNLSNATFGFLLSGQNISASYSYGPVTGWTLLNNSSPVEVLAGYWLDANTAGTINLTFVSTGQEVPASKNLTGDKWNAIGFSNITAVTASATLESVNGSWSTVLGWNATEQSYDASIIYGMNDNTTMTPGKGYWVWMTVNDTLAALSA
jgi:hypothetical protein